MSCIRCGWPTRDTHKDGLCPACFDYENRPKGALTRDELNQREKVKDYRLWEAYEWQTQRIADLENEVADLQAMIAERDPDEWRPIT